MVTATWEGSIQTSVTDKDLRETCQTGTDGHNISAVGHGSVWSDGGQWLQPIYEEEIECICTICTLVGAKK